MKSKKLLNSTLIRAAGQRLSERVTFIFFLNIVTIVFQLLYLSFRYKYLNATVPFWFTKPWGDLQLVAKSHLFYIPITSILILLGGAFFIYFLKKYYVRYFNDLILIFICLCNLVLTYSLVRIIQISSTLFVPLIDPTYVGLAGPFLFSFLLVLLIAPIFIEFAKEHNIITNPAFHNHPGMILLRPSARGGGFVFTLGFLLAAFLFVPFTQQYVGIYIVAALLAILGFIDDYQNTHQTSSFRIFEQPVLRLIILFILVSVVVIFNVRINFIANPIGGIINLNAYSFLISVFFTIVWIVWVLNVMSWSNGIDGQYAGIVGIAAVVIALLALRFSPLGAMDLNNAKLAIIVAGASFGLIPFTWHPSKIMWGFGAVSAALVLSALSILVSSKVATSIIIILIPFLDALVTVVRRLLQKKNPLKGDRGHLHHLLMDRGWNVKKIAVFYWVTTAFFGIVALLASEKSLALITLTFGGIVAFVIIMLNLKSLTKKQQSQTVV
ncbi:MAG TPA: MraY family glycosyltransferase [Candidatus Saccharimonadales bacterium]|nr:MraY family glycosyltransferase [Candidatus Saccharimonadales bacterium]